MPADFAVAINIPDGHFDGEAGRNECECKNDSRLIPDANHVIAWRGDRVRPGTLRTRTAAVVLSPVANMYAGPAADQDSRIAGDTRDERRRSSRKATVGCASALPTSISAGCRPRPSTKTPRAYATEGRVAEVASLYAHLYQERSVTKHAPGVDRALRDQARDREGGRRRRNRPSGCRYAFRMTGTCGCSMGTSPRGEAAVDPADDLTVEAVPRPPVHLGRHQQLRLRLLGFHPDAVSPTGPPDAARRPAAGRVERLLRR